MKKSHKNSVVKKYQKAILNFIEFEDKNSN